MSCLDFIFFIHPFKTVVVAHWSMDSYAFLAKGDFGSY